MPWVSRGCGGRSGSLELSGEWTGSAQSPAMTAHFSGPEPRLERPAPRCGVRGPCAGRWPRLGEEPEGLAVWRHVRRVRLVETGRLVAHCGDQGTEPGDADVCRGGPGAPQRGPPERPVARRRHLGSGGTTRRRGVAGGGLRGARPGRVGGHRQPPAPVQQPEGAGGVGKWRRARDGECAERWRQHRRAPDPRHAAAIRRARRSHGRRRREAGAAGRPRRRVRQGFGPVGRRHRGPVWKRSRPPERQRRSRADAPRW